MKCYKVVFTQQKARLFKAGLVKWQVRKKPVSDMDSGRILAHGAVAFRLFGESKIERPVRGTSWWGEDVYEMHIFHTRGGDHGQL